MPETNSATRTDPSNNQILAVLSQRERKRLLTGAEHVSFDYGDVLLEPNSPINSIYFPLRGAISLLSVLSGGASVEAGVVGREGVVGLGPLYGSDTAFFRLIVQGATEALRVNIDILHKEVDKRGVLFRQLQRFTAAFFMQVAQTAACNRLHANRQRLCRWLLMMHDRSGEDTFSMTHEFLSYMLGVGRVRVTEIARALQKERLIRYTWGKMTLLDRPRLEATACECYRSIKEKYTQILG